jgi:hypothetical protein
MRRVCGASGRRRTAARSPASFEAVDGRGPVETSVEVSAQHDVRGLTGNRVVEPVLNHSDMMLVLEVRGAQVVDVQLDDGALVALAGLERPLLEPPARDDAHAALQRLGDVPGRLAPDRAIGPSLRYATAKVTKLARTSANGAQSGPDPWASSSPTGPDEPPF